LSDASADDKFECAVDATHLRSSFIYLANAVNDLRGNWSTLALVLAPLVLLASLCLLPDALNLQYRVAEALQPPNSQNVMYETDYVPAQTPYAPPHNVPASRQPYPAWLTTTLDIAVIVLTIAVNLLVLCMLARIRAHERASTVPGEAFAIYRQAVGLVPGFAWIALLQAIAPILALAFLAFNFNPEDPAIYLVFGFVRAVVVAAAVVVYLWLYFAEYALVFDHKHSFHALLYSRDLMRKRFFRVSVRIVVFLAVWSGFNSWAALVFVAVSRLMGPVVVVTGLVAITIFLLDLISVSVSFATAAFFMAAGLRLYQDLNGSAVAEVALASPAAALPPTAPLSSAS
jgi:hypothetical protein